MNGGHAVDREWSEKNKAIRALLSKEASFRAGMDALVQFRAEMLGQIDHIMTDYPAEAFQQMPFAGAKGYHSKTLAYSVWHIFRIEDIVAHEMIAGDGQVLFSQGFDVSVRSPIVTTGNELSGDALVEFSRALDIPQLHRYARAVAESTDQLLKGLKYADLKRKFGEETRQRLLNSGCVSEDESARWLIDYWCGKDVRGLIGMPFSRHWIMHIEAMGRIKNRLCKTARRGVDPVACCGLSCRHCFLAEWCGSCRTDYNVCSCATCSPDGVCPNVKCCRERGIDGCYDCDSLEVCEKGFYTPSNDGASAGKAQALYIRAHGKKAFLAMHDRLHEKYDFAKTQEILGQHVADALRIMEAAGSEAGK